MHSPIPHNLMDDNKRSGSPTSSPSSKRSAFRPISKMVSKVNHDFLNRDPFAESSSGPASSSSSGYKERGIHVMTPAKGKLGSFFGGSGNTNATPSSSSTRMMRRPSATTSDMSGSTVSNQHDEPVLAASIAPMPKIRAGMTPEARTRHMPAPRPIPRHVLGSSQNQNQNQSHLASGDRPTTMRLVRNAPSEDGEGEGTDEGLPMLDSLGPTRRTDLHSPEDGMEALQAGMDDVSLDAWNASRGQDETVLVTIRIRPISSPNDSNAWSTLMDAGSSRPRTLRLADGSRRDWHFDQILPTTASNAETYLTSALPHVRSAMLGYNSLCFAYGQTGSGKSHTMSGTPQSPGVVPLAVEEIFRIIKRETTREWVLRASYLELYNEALGDLLAPEGSKGEVTILNGKKEGEVRINGLTEMVVTNVGEVKKVLNIGEGRRRTGCTDWNERSSRSHSVFRIVIESRAKGARDDDARGNNKATRISTLSLIDLAGSERATDNKERNAEGKHINQSLLTLKNVISKLAEQSAKKTTGHIPYRDSKLTRLLQPSLSGQARISVICTINPAHSAVAESQSTLNFAAGIKRVVLNAKQTEVVDPAALIQQYQNEIAELKAKLAARDAEAVEIDNGPKRTTMAQREERDRFQTRLSELKRLILDSSSVAEDEVVERSGLARPASPSKSSIEYDKSTYSLQQEAHVAQAKVAEQQTEIEKLKRELALRPTDVDGRISELQLQVDQLTEMTQEYEKNLLEPARKLREDVEAEWLPKVQALEARAKEKEIFYKALYDSVRGLKSENSKLKEKNARLESVQSEYGKVLHELETSINQENTMPASNSDSSFFAKHRNVSHGSDMGILRPVSDNARIPSVSMQTVNRNLAIANAQKGFGMRSLKEDSMFDLAKEVADLDRGLMDETF